MDIIHRSVGVIDSFTVRPESDGDIWPVTLLELWGIHPGMLRYYTACQINLQLERLEQKSYHQSREAAVVGGSPFIKSYRLVHFLNLILNYKITKFSI